MVVQKIGVVGSELWMLCRKKLKIFSAAGQSSAVQGSVCVVVAGVVVVCARGVNHGVRCESWGAVRGMLGGAVRRARVVVLCGVNHGGAWRESWRGVRGNVRGVNHGAVGGIA